MTHQDAARVGLSQLSLLVPTDTTGTRGTVEAATTRDIGVLERNGEIPDGTEALVALYQLLGREADRASIEKDRYGLINTSAKLASVRKDLSPLNAEGAPADLDAFWSDVSAHVGD